MMDAKFIDGLLTFWSIDTNIWDNFRAYSLMQGHQRCHKINNTRYDVIKISIMAWNRERQIEQNEIHDYQENNGHAR